MEILCILLKKIVRLVSFSFPEKRQNVRSDKDLARSCRVLHDIKFRSVVFDNRLIVSSREIQTPHTIRIIIVTRYCE